MPNSPSLDELLCALVFLLSRQALSPHLDLSAAIQEHMLMVADHPDDAELARIRRACQRLAEQWRPGAPRHPSLCPQSAPEAGALLH